MYMNEEGIHPDAWRRGEISLSSPAEPCEARSAKEGEGKRTQVVVLRRQPKLGTAYSLLSCGRDDLDPLPLPSAALCAMDGGPGMMGWMAP